MNIPAPLSSAPHHLQSKRQPPRPTEDIREHHSEKKLKKNRIHKQPKSTDSTKTRALSVGKFRRRRRPTRPDVGRLRPTARSPPAARERHSVDSCQSSSAGSYDRDRKPPFSRRRELASKCRECAPANNRSDARRRRVVRCWLWCDGAVLVMFAPRKCETSAATGKKKHINAAPWHYLMNCPLIRKCFGTSNPSYCLVVSPSRSLSCR